MARGFRHNILFSIVATWLSMTLVAGLVYYLLDAIFAVVTVAGHVVACLLSFAVGGLVAGLTLYDDIRRTRAKWIVLGLPALLEVFGWLSLAAYDAWLALRASEKVRSYLLTGAAEHSFLGLWVAVVFALSTRVAFWSQQRVSLSVFRRRRI
ncbi:MAG: hypothetical protein NZ749_12885 [bacterium]|nr:hypothetical protein [bacterium]